MPEVPVLRQEPSSQPLHEDVGSDSWGMLPEAVVAHIGDLLLQRIPPQPIPVTVDDHKRAQVSDDANAAAVAAMRATCHAWRKVVTGGVMHVPKWLILNDALKPPPYWSTSGSITTLRVAVPPKTLTRRRKEEYEQLQATIEQKLHALFPRLTKVHFQVLNMLDVLNPGGDKDRAYHGYPWIVSRNGPYDKNVVTPTMMLDSVVMAEPSITVDMGLSHCVLELSGPVTMRELFQAAYDAGNEPADDHQRAIAQECFGVTLPPNATKWDSFLQDEIWFDEIDHLGGGEYFMAESM